MMKYIEFITVDAIDPALKAIQENDGWEFLHAGMGAYGQTTLTFGWIDNDEDVIERAARIIEPIHEHWAESITVGAGKAIALALAKAGLLMSNG